MKDTHSFEQQTSLAMRFLEQVSLSDSKTRRVVLYVDIHVPGCHRRSELGATRRHSGFVRHKYLDSSGFQRRYSSDCRVDGLSIVLSKVR